MFFVRVALAVDFA